MRKTILLLLAVLISGLGFAQEGFNYKALVTNNGTPVASGLINVKVTIKSSGGAIRWQEEHTAVSTDANGIFSIAIGEGTRLGGASTFDDVYWSYGNTISIEVNTGSGYTSLVNDEPLRYVPYAKRAKTLVTEDDAVLDRDARVRFSEFGNFLGGPRYYMGLNAAGDALELGTFSFTFPTTYFPKLSIKNNGDLLTTGKILADDSGDSDMKAYIYGKVYDNGTLPGSPTPNSGGFSVTKTGTGVYKITFDTSPGSYNNYLVIASRYSSGLSPGFIQTQSSDAYFTVYTYDASGNPADRPFMFVVYKK